MTGHDSGTTSCRTTGNRGGSRDAAPDVAIEVRASVAEQGHHGPPGWAFGNSQIEEGSRLFPGIYVLVDILSR